MTYQVMGQGQTANQRESYNSDLQNKLGIERGTRLSSIDARNLARIEKDGTVTFAIDTDGRNRVGISYVRSNGGHLTEDCYSNNQVGNLARLGELRMTDGTFSISASERGDKTRVLVNVSSDLAAVKIRLGNETYLVKIDDLREYLNKKHEEDINRLRTPPRKTPERENPQKVRPAGQSQEQPQGKNGQSQSTQPQKNPPSEAGGKNGTQAQGLLGNPNGVKQESVNGQGKPASNDLPTNSLTIAAVKVLKDMRSPTPRAAKPTPTDPDSATTPKKSSKLTPEQMAQQLEAEIVKVEENIKTVRKGLKDGTKALEPEEALKKLNKDYAKLQKEIKAYQKAVGATSTTDTEALLKRGNAALDDCLQGRRAAAELMAGLDDNAKTAAVGKNALVSMADDVDAMYGRQIAAEEAILASKTPTDPADLFSKQSLELEREAFTKNTSKLKAEGYGSMSQKVDDFVATHPKVQSIMNGGRAVGGWLSKGKEWLSKFNQNPVGTLKSMPGAGLEKAQDVTNVLTSRNALANAEEYLTKVDATDAKAPVMKDLDKLESGLSKRQAYLDGKTIATDAVKNELAGIKEARGKLAVKANEILTKELDVAKAAHKTKATPKTAAAVSAVEEKLYGKWGEAIEATAGGTPEFKTAREAHVAKSSTVALDKELASFKKSSEMKLIKNDSVQSAERAKARAIADVKNHPESTFAKAEADVVASKAKLAELEALSKVDGVPDGLKAHIDSSIEAEKARATSLKDIADECLIKDLEKQASMPAETQKYLLKSSLATATTEARADLAELQKSLAEAIDEPAKVDIKKRIKTLEASIAQGELEHLTNSINENQGSLKKITDRLAQIEDELAKGTLNPKEAKLNPEEVANLTREKALRTAQQVEAKALNEMFEAQKEILSQRATIAAKHLELHEAKVTGGKAPADLNLMESDINSLEKATSKLQAKFDASMSKKLAEAKLNFKQTMRNGFREAAYYAKHPLKGAVAGTKKVVGTAFKSVGTLNESMVGEGRNPSFTKMAVATAAVESLARVGGADYSPETRHTAVPHLIIALNRQLGSWEVEDLGQGETSSFEMAVAKESASAAGDTTIALAGGATLVKTAQGVASATSWAANGRYLAPLTNWAAGTRVGIAASSSYGGAISVLKSPLFGSGLAAVGAGYGGYKAYSGGQFRDMNDTQLAFTTGGYISAGVVGGTMAGGLVGAVIGGIGGAGGELYGVKAGLDNLDKQIDGSWIKKGATETIRRGLYGLTSIEKLGWTEEKLEEERNKLKEEEREVIDHFALVETLPTILGKDSSYTDEEKNKLGLLRTNENSSEADKEKIGEYNWARINKLVHDGGLKKVDRDLSTKVTTTFEKLKLDYTALYFRSYKKEYENIEPESGVSLAYSNYMKTGWAAAFFPAQYAGHRIREYMAGPAPTKRSGEIIKDKLFELTSAMEKHLSDASKVFNLETFLKSEKSHLEWDHLKNNPAVREELLLACFAGDHINDRKLVNAKAFEMLESEFQIEDETKVVDEFVTSIDPLATN